MASTIPSQSISASTIVIATIGTLTALTLGYAAYFDHRRRYDPAFRRSLRRAQHQVTKVDRESVVNAEKLQKQRVKQTIEDAIAEGFPTDADEKEALFMEEVGAGERMSSLGADPMESALHFYRAMKVYPQPIELLGIYEKTVPKPVLDVLAEMLMEDPSFASPGQQSAPSLRFAVE